MNCPNCGAPIIGKTCEYCGTLIAQESERATVNVVNEYVDIYDWDGNVVYRVLDKIEQRRADADVDSMKRIVRCRDCKRVTIDQGDHDYREPLWCGLFRMDVSLDGFCAWGVRREDA